MVAASEVRALAQTTATPPAEFLSVLAVVGELGYRPNDKLPATGWIAKRPCRAPEPDCGRYFVCRGLRASYFSSLVPDEAAWSKELPGKRHRRSLAWLWSWSYDSAETAALALKALEYFNGVGVYGCPYHNDARLVFSEGARVLVLSGHGHDAHALSRTADRIRRRLKSESTAAAQDAVRKSLHGKWYGIYSGASAPPPPSRLNGLQNANLSDAETSALLERLLRLNARPDDLASKLNARGMRLYKRGEYERATRMFEWANELSFSHPKAAYNRAALAARANDSLGAVYWLWRLRFMRIDDYNPGSEETDLLVEKSRKDSDFDPVRQSDEFRAFEACIPESDRSYRTPDHPLDL